MIKKLVIEWAINWALAWLARWLDQNQPTARIQTRERPAPILKPKGPGKPPGPRRAPKYPVDTRPGRWNRQTGSFNP
jgi:hypothetical protein